MVIAPSPRPAAGFTILRSHLNVRIKGLSNLKINGQNPYPIDECEILPHRDIGDACLFLASPLASYISGASLAVHGGGEAPSFLDAANVDQE